MKNTFSNLRELIKRANIIKSIYFQEDKMILKRVGTTLCYYDMLELDLCQNQFTELNYIVEKLFSMGFLKPIYINNVIDPDMIRYYIWNI
jgi:hypothetical protein